MFNNFDYSNIGIQNELLGIGDQLERLCDILDKISEEIIKKKGSDELNGKY